MAHGFQKNLVALIRGAERILMGAIIVPLPSDDRSRHDARV